ncbi:hypothetical protein GP486_001395 [Trichoglossum hirsutum]|uniref:5'-3' DNA helicase ZGRF1-like N-terminal domain-containing protein n=1 Tax=Trichoglossum hirsutum TaxID=265104 RepID=A0A9P8LH32_9PEZI|nr:hypothetical protein GP486_001395 [Trichoglossum hirsutum]
MVYDDARNFIGDMHYTDSGEIHEGDDLVFEAFLVQVSECTKTVQQDLTPLFTPKLRRREEIYQESSVGTGRTLTAGTPAQSRLLQGRVQGGSSQAMAPQTPLSQLRAKSLNALLGVAKGSHGRALLPKFSPFEERQRGLNDTHTEGRPSKRQKRNLPRANNDGANIDSHFVPVSLEQSSPVEVRKESLLYRTDGRWEQQNEGGEGSFEIRKRPVTRSGEAPQEPRPRKSPNGSRLALKEANRQIRSSAISIESDPEPIEGPCADTSRGQRDLNKSPNSHKEDAASLYEKYPLQPLRILATYSSRKSKLLCKEAPPKPSKGEVSSRVRFQRWQQLDVSQQGNGAPEQRGRIDSAPLRSPSQASRRKRRGVGQADPLPELGQMDQQPATDGKSTSVSTVAETSNDEYRPTSRGSFGQSVRSRQERKRNTPERVDVHQRPVSRIPKSAACAFPAFDGGRGDMTGEDLGGPWSKEAIELFDWHPPSIRENRTGTSLFVSQD